jgi:hypothetical protein
MFFGKKDPKKDNSPSYKVNTLACYMLFGPMKSIYFSYKQLGYLLNYNHHFCENKMGLCWQMIYYIKYGIMIIPCLR